MEEKIKELLEQVRPFLQKDGGDVKYIAYDEKRKVVWVELEGHCFG